MTAPMTPPVPAIAGRRQRVRAFLRQRRGLLIFVILPTVLAAIYYGLVAADLYASEARFVVRSPSRMPVGGGLAGLLQTTGFSGAHDDVYSVQDFATSRDALTALSKATNLRAMFNPPEADFFARYPNLLDDATDEDFFEYYKRRVTVVFDTTTGISTLTVKAFRADDAQQVARLVLDQSEALVNRLNERARANAVRDAEDEVRIAQEQAADAEAEVLAYRNRESMINPGEASSAMFKTLASLQADAASVRVRIEEIERRSPDSPLLGELRTRLSALEQQVDRERGQLAGRSGGSMAPKIAEFELLELRREFAAKQLASAMASVEAARAEARRQQIYLDRVVEPSHPDKALYPRRARNVFVVFVSMFLIYSIGALLVAGVREHAQH